MYVEIPLLRAGGSLKDQEELLTCVNHSPWEIDVARDNDLSWSIALSYLMTNVENSKTVPQKLQLMLDSEYNDSKSVSIQWYNPFLNRYACFYNEGCRDFILKFKRRLMNFVKGKKHGHLFDESFPKVRKYKRKVSLDSMLQAASYILQCKIYLISESKSDIRVSDLHDPSLTCYPKGGDVPWDQKVILYGKSKIGNECDRISFGISEKTASAFQKTALSKILRLGGLFREGHAIIFPLREVRDSLILGLLKKKEWKIVEKLLKKPKHILQKLYEAGFGTDPSTTLLIEDKLEELFYQTLCSGGVKLLFLFYSCFTNISTLSCSESSARQPDACIVSNLMAVTPVINKTRRAFESSEVPNKIHVIAITQLEEFHAFHLRVCRTIHDIKERINYSDRVSDELYTVEKRKDSVLAIVEAYREHFNMRLVISSSENNMQLIRYENYAKHQMFFQNLDFQAALFFFDNSFALKQKLKLDDKAFDKMEASIARFLFLWKYYYENANYFDVRRRHSSTSDKNVGRQEKISMFVSPARHLNKFLLALTHLERLKVENALEEFQNKLESTEIEQKRITQCLSPSCVHTLEDEPIIKDEITLLRLKHYIDIALGVNLEDNLEMSVAAVERCLQVIGESLSIPDEETITVAKSLLTSSLPHDVQEFRRIRDSLSHLKSTVINARMEMENNAKFFQDIVEELKSINSEFLHIFELQQLRMKKYALQNGIQSVKKWIVSLKKSLKKHSPVLKFPRQEEVDIANCLFPMAEDDIVDGNLHTNESGTQALDNSTSSSFKEFEKYSKWRMRVLRMCLEKTNIELCEKALNLISHKHFETNFNWLELRYKNLVFRSGKMEDYKPVENRLLSIKCLLEFIVNESRCKEKTIKMLRQKISDVSVEDIYVPEKAKDLLKEYRELVIYVFDELRVLDKVSSSRRSSSSSGNETNTNIQMLKRNLTDYNLLSEQTKENILTKVPEKYIEHHKAKDKLRTSLETENILTDEERSETIEKLIINPKIKKKTEEMYNWRNLAEIQKIPDYYEVLMKSLSNEAISEKDYNVICDEFGFTEREQKEMSKIILRQSSKEKVPKSNIQKFKYALTGRYMLSEQTTQRILAEVPEEFKSHHEAKKKLKSSLETGSVLSEQEKAVVIGQLAFDRKKLEKVKEMYDKKDLRGIEKLSDHYETLCKCLDDNEMNGGEFNTVCSKFNFSEEAQNELSKTVLGRSAKDETLEYFHDRLIKLKKLLIEAYPEINSIWTKATSLKSREYGRNKLVHYYLQQPPLQAAVEQILFDCMVILKEKGTYLKDLWVKTTYLFNGINLRNVLAHGNPLFESVGHILDPNDLPYEIITKALELVSDIDAIEAMCHLRKEKDIGFEDVVENVKCEEHEDDSNLWIAIKECCKWECYAYLLPRKRTRAIFSSNAEPEDDEENEDKDEVFEFRG